MNWRLALLSMVPIPLDRAGDAQLCHDTSARHSASGSNELGELNATLNDNLSGIREIKAFTQEEREAQHVGEHIQPLPRFAAATRCA